MLSLIGGCTDSGTPVVNGKYYAVRANGAAFYHYGPQQANGPDKKLKRDTLLNVVNSSFGYCKIRLLNGEEGYVATEDIHLASPELVAATTAPPPMNATSRIQRFRLNSSDPRLIAPPEALPLDLPEPTPIPGTESSPP
jgi:hypothetical protein